MKNPEVLYQGTTYAAAENLGRGFYGDHRYCGGNTENTGSIGLVKNTRTDGNLFGNLISPRPNLLADDKEPIVERDIPNCERMPSTGFIT